jgi:predicted transcriptional regulator
MATSTITFRTDSAQLRALDRIAAALKRDRSYVLNEALRTYVESYRWQVDEIKKGVAEAEGGDFASATEVKAVFSRLTRKGPRRTAR